VYFVLLALKVAKSGKRQSFSLAFSLAFQQDSTTKAPCLNGILLVPRNWTTLTCMLLFVSVDINEFDISPSLVHIIPMRRAEVFRSQ